MIQINNVTKLYNNKVALDSVNITLPKQGVFGVVGPNGSGKTSLFKAITGLITYKGKITIDEKNVLPQKCVAYFPKLYLNMKVHEMMQLITSLYTDFNSIKMNEICKEFQLNTNDLINHLSKGQQACLSFAFTVSRDVPYYILDEPFDGIDINTKEMILNNLIKYLDFDQKLLLISSHELHDLERIIDHIIIMSEGRVIENIREFNNNLEDLMFRSIEGVRHEK